MKWCAKKNNKVIFLRWLLFYYASLIGLSGINKSVSLTIHDPWIGSMLINNQNVITFIF